MPIASTTRRAAALGVALLLLTWGAVPAALADDAPPVPPPPGGLRAEVPAPPPTAPATTLQRGTPARWAVDLEVGAGIGEDPEGILGLALPRGTQSFDWGENDFDPGLALRLTVARHIRPCERIEVRGGWQGWSADSRQTARFGFSQTPGGGLMVSPTATATLENEVDLWGVEVNWWRTIPGPRTSRFAWGLGARVVSLTDTATARDWVGLAPDSYLRGKARNTLWAAQAMGAWHLRPSRHFEFAILGKGLVGALNRDLTERDTSIVTGGATVNAERERTDFGWGLEGEVRAMWRPWARVGLTASYTVLFLDDVSRGHEILDLGQAATGSVQIRDVTDSAVIHTLYFGVHFDI